MSNQQDFDPAAPPEFVRPKDGETDLALASSWDGWVVKPTGDHKTDYMKGAEYCDVALRKVTATQNPAALDFTLVTIISKILAGKIERGAMEKGFIDRLISHACDRRQQLDSN